MGVVDIETCITDQSPSVFPVGFAARTHKQTNKHKKNTNIPVLFVPRQGSNMDDGRDGRGRKRRYKVLPDPLQTPSLSPSSSSEPPSPLTPSPPRPPSPRKKRKKKIDICVDAIMNRPINHTGYWYTSNPVDRRSPSPPPPPKKQQQRWLFHTNGPATAVQRWQESLYGGGGGHHPPPYISGCRYPPTPSSRRHTPPPPPPEPEPMRYGGSSSLEFSWPDGWDK